MRTLGAGLFGVSKLPHVSSTMLQGLKLMMLQKKRKGSSLKPQEAAECPGNARVSSRLYRPMLVMEHQSWPLRLCQTAI